MMNDKDPELRKGIGKSTLLMILCVLFGIMLICFSLCVPLLDSLGADRREALLATSSLQNVAVFIIPALATATAASRRPASFCALNNFGHWKNYLGMVLLFIVGLPALNYIIAWNEGLHLPQSMASVENALRTMEENAAEISSIMLDADSLGAMLVGVLVIGLLTGFSEELTFRGTLQRILSLNGTNRNMTVWTAAVIFSLLHFQFFGFIPRMLLGAAFGYLLATTGSLWVAIAAHALNNSLVVVTTWLSDKGMAASFIKGMEFGPEHSPVIPLLSLLAFAAIIRFAGRRLFFNHKSESNLHDNG